MRITFEVDDTVDDATAKTVNAVASEMAVVLGIIAQKEMAYGSAWKAQGWVGNLARVLSKTSRLRNMLWREEELMDSKERVSDTLHDLTALAMFMAINIKENNKWGS